MMQNIMAKNLRIASNTSSSRRADPVKKYKMVAGQDDGSSPAGKSGMKHGRTQSSSGVGHNRSNQRISPRLAELEYWCGHL